MAETVAGRRLRAGGVGRVLAGAIALAVLAGAGAITAKANSAAAIFLLHGGALLGVALAWVEARRAHQAAEKASAELTSLSGRVLQLEFRLLQQNAPAPDSRLQSAVREVTGEVGRLGGLVRDLGETLAAQDRDVADLKERLVPAGEVPSSEPGAPGRASAEARHPEPSLLPTARRESQRPVAGPATYPEAPKAAAAGGASAQANANRLHGRDAPISDAEARRMAAIVQASEADRVELHLQPIVALPKRTVRFYEVLARLRLADDTVLLPHEFLPLLERLGRVPEFDRRVLVRAIAIARHLAARGSEALVSVNLSSRAVDEPGFLGAVARLFEASPDAVGRVVLELPQGCWQSLDRERAGGLAALRARGVPLALDRATDLSLDPHALAERGVRFVKVSADLLLGTGRNGVLEVGVRDLASVLRRAGLELVAECVEREDTVPELLDRAVPLAQGFIFAPPRAIRAEVPGAPASAPSGDLSLPASPPAARGSAGGGPLPFRPVLRAC